MTTLVDEISTSKLNLERLRQQAQLHLQQSVAELDNDTRDAPTPEQQKAAEAVYTTLLDQLRQEALTLESLLAIQHDRAQAAAAKAINATLPVPDVDKTQTATDQWVGGGAIGLGLALVTVGAYYLITE
jgi:hypothetical protein